MVFRLEEISIKNKKFWKFSKLIGYRLARKTRITQEIPPDYNRKSVLILNKCCILWGFCVLEVRTTREAVLSGLRKIHFVIVRMKEIMRSYFFCLNLDLENIWNILYICRTLTHQHRAWPARLLSWYRFSGLFYNNVSGICGQLLDIFGMTKVTSSRLIEVHIRWREDQRPFTNLSKQRQLNEGGQNVLHQQHTRNQLSYIILLGTGLLRGETMRVRDFTSKCYLLSVSLLWHSGVIRIFFFTERQVLLLHINKCM